MAGLLALLVGLSACDRPPQGALGLRWGQESTAAAQQLGLDCTNWSPWSAAGVFEVCQSEQHSVPAFGLHAQVRLIRRGTALQGVQLSFRDCGEAWDGLRDAIRDEFRTRTSDPKDVYTTWDGGELVRLVRDRTSEVCTLTVAGPDFGRRYSSELLKAGLFRLGGALRPH